MRANHLVGWLVARKCPTHGQPEFTCRVRSQPGFMLGPFSTEMVGNNTEIFSYAAVLTVQVISESTIRLIGRRTNTAARNRNHVPLPHLGSPRLLLAVSAYVSISELVLCLSPASD